MAGAIGVSQIVADYLRRTGKSQTELGAEIGRSGSWVSRLLTYPQMVRLSVEDLRRLADAMGMDRQELYRAAGLEIDPMAADPRELLLLGLLKAGHPYPQARYLAAQLARPVEGAPELTAAR